MVKKGLFREDLFYRISVLPINVPPLKERGKDITILSQIFAGRIGERMGKGQPILSAEALDYLQAYCWPGNVRELRNVIERALILSNNNEIYPNHLPAEIRRTPPAAEGDVSPGFAELRSLSQVKDDYINYVLKMTGNNHSRTAAILGISRSTLLAGLKRKP
jgi:DNA-binding NtrC family response regulator